MERCPFFPQKLCEFPIGIEQIILRPACHVDIRDLLSLFLEFPILYTRIFLRGQQLIRISKNMPGHLQRQDIFHAPAHEFRYGVHMDRGRKRDAVRKGLREGQCHVDGSVAAHGKSADHCVFPGHLDAEGILQILRQFFSYIRAIIPSRVSVIQIKSIPGCRHEHVHIIFDGKFLYLAPVEPVCIRPGQPMEQDQMQRFPFIAVRILRILHPGVIRKHKRNIRVLHERLCIKFHSSRSHV